MRALLVLLCAAFLIALSNVCFAAEPCIGCEELAGLPQANLLTEMREAETTLKITAYYENTSATPPRQPIQDSVLIVEITNSTGLKELYIIYTNDKGEAPFDFSAWSEGCINFKVLYCPFCIPDAPECGFIECLTFANIRTEAGYYGNIGSTEITNLSDIPDAIGTTKPFPLNDSQYLPEIKTANYCPPPPPLTETPALCLPLLIIFSLLAGSLYLTGRNPFAGFNIGAPRIGKHIRYQARGRGYYLSGMAVASAASRLLRAGAVLARKDRVKTDKDGKPVLDKDGKPVIIKGGWKGLVAEEKAAAEARGIFGVAQVKRIKAAAKRGKEIRDMMKEGKEAIRKGAPAKKVWADVQRRIEVTSTGAGRRITKEAGLKEGEEGGVVMTGSGEPLLMPGSLSISPKFGELFGEEGKYGLGFLTYLVTSTPVGSIVDSMYRSGRVLAGKTDKSIFESVFIDYSARKQETTKAMSEMLGTIKAEGEKPIIGMKVNLGEGRGEMLLTDVEPGKQEGTMVYTVGDPTGKGGVGTVTVDANNKVIASSEAAKGMGLDVGSDASQFTESVSTTIRDFGDMATTVSESLQREREDERDRAQTLLEQDSVAQMHIPDLRDEKASSTLQSTIGVKSVVGVKPVETEYGKEMGPEASYTVRVADAHAETFGSDKFQSDLSEKSGLPKDSMERTHFERAMNNVINSTNPETLEKMTPKDFRQALFDVGISEQNAAKVKDDAFNVVRDTAREFEKTVKENIWGDDLKRTLGSDVSQISKIASTGHQVKDDNASSLLLGKLDDVSMSPEMFMSPETRKELKERVFLDSMSPDAERMSEALKGGTKEAKMSEFFSSWREYADKNTSLLNLAPVNRAHTEGYLGDKFYKKMDGALDMHRQGDQLKSTLESSGFFSPKHDEEEAMRNYINNEKRARERIADLYAKGDLPSAYAMVLSQREANQTTGNKNAANSYGKAADMIAKEIKIGQPPPKTKGEMKSRLSDMNGTLKAAGKPERLAANAAEKYRKADKLIEKGTNRLTAAYMEYNAYETIAKLDEEYRKRMAKK